MRPEQTTEDQDTVIRRQFQQMHDWIKDYEVRQQKNVPVTNTQQPVPKPER